MSARVRVCVCKGERGGGELFVNACRMCVQESVCVSVKEGAQGRQE